MRRFLLLLIALVAFPLAATEPNPTALQRELIEKLMSMTDDGTSMQSMIDMLFGAIEKQSLDRAAANGNSAEAIAESKELYETFRKAAAKVDFNALLRESTVRMYAKYFTEQELADLIAFYSTPTGRKAIDVMPDLMREGMEAGVEHVTPKIEALMKEAQEQVDRNRPWRRTMNDMRALWVALEAYQIDHETFPSSDYAGLKALLADYIDAFPEKDVWGNPYAYVVSEDGKNYRIVSAGADSIFDWDSRRIMRDQKLRYRDRLEDDVIFADGEFVQLPVQARTRD